ncbi:hypothetical protein HYX00_05370 [Candidatus Woesearchaeota archaeon]|nr:hypothetical protein [Candidatus Woesearchaeota archaeon]
MYSPSLRKKNDETDIDTIISKFKDLSKEDKIELISYFIDELKKFHNVNEQEIFGKREISISIGVFANDVLSSLEAIVKYLKEEQKLKFSKIGKLLNRSNKTIWATYHNAIKKMPSSFGAVSRDILIPVSALSNRQFSTLESVVGFIKDLDYTNHEVALMLHLDDRTIWTIYDRVKKKRGIKA